MEDLEVTPSFWRGRSVFLTGHTGFKGGWLSIWLQSLGAKVTGYSLQPSTKPSLFSVAHVEHGMTSVIGDIRDYDSLEWAIRKSEAEIVIHMAAQPLVRYSYAHPVETYGVNVMGTVHVLEAARQAGHVKAIVNITSDKCYENREWIWGYRETDRMGGHDPYSSSKGCAELVAAAYRNSYFGSAHSEERLSLASARAGNVIGGGDWSADRLIPDLIRAFQDDKEVVIRSPDAVRPWQHVLEPLRGYLMLAERLYSSSGYDQGWNFGPRDEDAKPVRWIVEELVHRWGGSARYRIDRGEANLHEANYLKLDCSSARTRLGWFPRWSLGVALDKIVEWHKAMLSKTDMREITLAQIHEYGARSESNRDETK